MRSLTVRIPQPCPERWAYMQPAKQGRFCASCRKTVVDYSALSDREILRLLSRTSSETACGRFRSEQLNRPLAPANPGTTSGWRHWAGLLTMSLFGWQTARAQVNQTGSLPQPTTIQPFPPVQALPIKNQLGPDKKWDRNWVITGRVMLQDSNGNQSPLTGVSVLAYGLAVQTYSTGKFKLQAHTRAELRTITVHANAPDHRHGQATFDVSASAASTTSIALNDIVLYQDRQCTNIVGGGLAIVRAPSRWQKLKRRLFN